ncbi:polysaccharide deacetylase family protein [Halalkalibaculum sp. DA3122]|uniref:polysaccharide deacetylase family protein n=1 Tax=Halalkalibaculum sp. DA3122 TaxID=3373607 RepID=UPI003754AD70
MEIYLTHTSLAVVLISMSIISAKSSTAEAQDQTYAEKLGFPENATVLIMHIDDVGMSHDSNRGAIHAMEKGVANSLSIMMPCAWVPEFARYYKQHPDIDAGLHLTLTSEWDNYRWGPVSGATCNPSLADRQGAFYPSVEEVVQHAEPDEVEDEIRAQIELARNMGFSPTHLDSHMGTLFATADLMQIYINLGIEYQIPVMFPAGHSTLIRQQRQLTSDQHQQMQEAGRKLWAAGLPVLDDLHNFSYGWEIPREVADSDKKLQAYWTQKYIDSFEHLEPGVTMMIMHCTDPSETFAQISDSGTLRKADMLAMTSTRLKNYIEKEGIILTTWKELKRRRDSLQKK